MFKKGLITLVCLAVMSAVCAWAATTYSLRIQVTNAGGTITAGTLGSQTNAGIQYFNPTGPVLVNVAPATGFKIKEIVRVTGTQKQTLVAGTDYIVNATTRATNVTVTPTEDPTRVGYQIQGITATFESTNVVAGAPKTWQLQLQNTNLGGTIVSTKVTPTGTLTNTVTAAGAPKYINYNDTGAVTVTVTANAGNVIKSINTTGTIADADKAYWDTAKKLLKSVIIKGIPAPDKSVNPVIVSYAKQTIRVTTNTDVNPERATNPLAPEFEPNGIAPINPDVAYGGTARFIITPTGTNNLIKSITPAEGPNVVYTDRFGNPADVTSTKPFQGPIKVTISNITAPLTVSALFGRDTSVVEYDRCANTCHMIAEVPVDIRVDVPAQWKASKHAVAGNNVGCVTCHKTMPGPEVTSADCKLCHDAKFPSFDHADLPKAQHNAATGTDCAGCHNPHSGKMASDGCASCHAQTTAQWAAGHHGAAEGHTTGTCQRCHATEGALQGAAIGWTGGYNDVLKKTLAANGAPYGYTPVPAYNGIACAACHDQKAAGGLVQVKTIDATTKEIVNWDPNNNGTNDQYDVCTSCHTLTDKAGAVVGNYHDGSSMDVARTISDSHYDNPATAAAGASAVVEGYVIRKTSANPCADCHNLHSADLEIQEAWAESAHAGKIAAKKAEAACAPALTWWNASKTDKATACTDVKSVVSGSRTTTTTVLGHFGKSADGIAFYKTTGALDDHDGNGWTHYNWDQTSSRGSCQRCHTATGIANFLDNPATYVAAGTGNDFSHLSSWTTTSGSPQNELLYCWGCHSDSQTGALRNPAGGITEVYAAATSGAPTATIAFGDLGKSNVCMGCHLGRQIGQNVKNDTDADGIRSFINSHYLAAGLTISGKGGYEFAGQTYPSGYHDNVGINNAYNTGTAGPCVTCHMSGAEGHTFEVSAASTACANCHSGLTAEILEESKHEFHLALEELNQALIAKGIHFYPAHPYFYAGANGTGGAFTNWAGVYGLDKWKDVMGAAFNYNLIDHEPGAFAHNRGYALKLIQDSIDFLADGAVDGQGVTAAFTAAAANKEFAAATGHAAPVVEVSSSTSCATCHAPTAHYGGQAFHKAQYVGTTATSCENCHGKPVSTTANQEILAQYAVSAHADPDGEAWLHSDWRSGNRSACARCHTTTAFVAKLGKENDTSNVFQLDDVLKPAETLACSACHTNAGTGALRVAASAFTINIKNGTAAYDVPGASALCARCHSGRETGESITADPNTTGIRVFVDSHYAPAAATLYNKGYDFGLNSGLGAHKNLGATGQGPCVTCHMPDKDHSFAAASCVTCHDGMDAAAKKAEYDAALNTLKLKLEAKGIHYGPVHPFFFTAPYVAGGANTPVTNWGAAYGASNWKHTMGAAYNYNLFWSEKGAWAHNNSYAMKLIADSIDFMTDGALGL